MRCEHRLVLGDFLEQSHLKERLLENVDRFGIEGQVLAEDADLLVIGAATAVAGLMLITLAVISTVLALLAFMKAMVS